MNHILRFLVIILAMGCSFAVGIWSSMVGWGLTVHSWRVIILASVLQVFFSVIIALAKEIK